MEKLQTGTLSELRGDSVEATKLPTGATIKVANSAPTDTNTDADVLDAPNNLNAATIIKVPAEKEPSQATEKDKPCTICKAKSVASLAFSFSLVILVLAFSFSLVKAPTK